LNIRIDHSNKQIPIELQPRTVTFTGNKTINLGIFWVAIYGSSLLTLFVSSLSDHWYFVSFGAFVVSPIVVLGLGKIHYTTNRIKAVNLMKIFLFVLIGIFIYLNLYPKLDPLTLIIFGFFFNSILLTAWMVMPYSTTIDRKIDGEKIYLNIYHKRLFIGKSLTQISMRKGDIVSIEPSNVRRSVFSKSFVYHHLHSRNSGFPNPIPFLPVGDRGFQMASKLQEVFEGSDCKLIIDISLLNSNNIFQKLIFPKVSRRFDKIGNEENFPISNKLMLHKKWMKLYSLWFQVIQ
jgi:hypothetical protein